MPSQSCVENGIGTLRCIPVLIGNIVNGAAILAGVAAVFFIVIAGIRFLTSGGDPTKVAQARSTMTYAIIGLVLLALSFVIIKVFSTIGGIDCHFIGVNC